MGRKENNFNLVTTVAPYFHRPPEWMLERGKWQEISWTELERGTLWLRQPLLLLQPDQTGECPCVRTLVTHFAFCFTLISSIFNFFFPPQPLLFNSSVEGRCYRHRCAGANRYQIQVSGSEWVDCPAGGTIQVHSILLYVTTVMKIKSHTVSELNVVTVLTFRSQLSACP